MKVIFSFTNIAPHYREKLWSVLLASDRLDFHFVFGDAFKSGIKAIDFSAGKWDEFRRKLHRVRNIRLRNVVVWQQGVISLCMRSRYDVAIFIGDMYILSTWIGAIIARLRGRRVLMWGHGIYGNESFVKRKIRSCFYCLSHGHLLYGNYGKQQMLRQGFKAKNLHVVYNSLDYDQHRMLRERCVIPEFYRSGRFFKHADLPVLIFIGRLTAEKRLDLLIEAVAELNNEKPTVNLMIVGDGPQRNYLGSLSAQSMDQIYFYGSCYNEEDIGKLIANADLCVSPGNVGLTAIHSLSFGTPVCTHDDVSNQMPEAEAVKEGITGLFFHRNSSDDLTTKIRQWISLPVPREEIRKQCYQMIDQYYNPYHQLGIFREILLCHSR